MKKEVYYIHIQIKVFITEPCSEYGYSDLFSAAAK